jgi:mitochondrial import receptor subunit TOM40
MFLQKLSAFFLISKTAKCETFPVEDLPEDKISIDDEELLEEKTHHIPSFLYLLQPVKFLTMGYPDSEINGFKFSLGSPLSQNFLMSHTINMAPKKQQVSTGNPMMDMFAEKTPYYTLGVQYHHGNLMTRNPHIAYSLVGRVDTTGRLDSILVKNFKNWKVKVQSSFLNSNVAFAQSNCEVEHSGLNTKQTATFSTGALNYNIVERLGSKLMMGFDLTFVPSRNLWANGFAMRFIRKSSERFYVQFSGLANSLTLSGWFKLNESTSLATEMEFGGPNVSDASLGYRTKAKGYEVNSVIKSNGDIKSIFSYSQMQMYKLRLFLSGNLFKEDFRSGFAFSVGQTDE